ncbi:ADP-heptose synthase bifunctional sugar kinase/adenylyltransferase-like protein [Candidatus Koribacter versatilis Ellin345]|uniref:ADP-heptose synthase bifunctional sugar kinase/adenylyltransferase-like protein n=1 Tax=Koribacter versatilis (strain Ellin345) TaxID=204669 RepID=Q1IHD1_KORVE|nr:ADP-heptose synthase [Candidatus Koribacter versatilis]ABF43719.1 ADP-heptose synthase bifunctional sugar kinase/adenylyltransferase-like protein [Candidatus Koribacter versatilis Ellin345]
MSKGQDTAKLVDIFESLSDVTLTIVADFLDDLSSGGANVALRLADIGASVFPVGVVGEDEGGQKIFHALQQHKISTSGISRIKNYATPSSSGNELLHGEHPALLNLVEHARKFASASDGMYVCDYGIGAASPRLLNFIKSNGCLREKTLVARSLHRLAEFEQLTAAVASGRELEEAIGVEIGGDAEKLEAAAEGMKQELQSDSFVAVDTQAVFVLSGRHRPDRISIQTSADVDLLGAFFAAGLAAGAEARESAELAAKIVTFFGARNPEKRPRREEVQEFLTSSKASRQVR